MKKCMACGREGNAPHVRGVKSAAVQLGNFREQVDVDATLCEACAGRVMQKAMDALIVEMLGRDPR